MTRRTDGGEGFDALAGLWKLGCALAVLVGHNLVTVTILRPGPTAWNLGFRALQIFSPLHFFFFSGYLAYRGLSTPDRPLAGSMVSRAFRIYVLVASALALGLACRWLFTTFSGPIPPDAVWPLSNWSGGIDPGLALRNLSPLGLADTTRFNYATWYIYQELRLVAFFPVFRWILSLRSRTSKASAVLALLGGAAILENRLWMHFPAFRSSPFQTLAFAVFFLVGALVAQGFAPGGALRNLPRRTAWGLLLLGTAFAILEPLGIHPPLRNPPILMIQTLIGQAVVFAALHRLLGDFQVGAGVRKACAWSVGIYVVHPPIHAACTWWAARSGSIWPLFAGMTVSVMLGVAFHRLVEVPSLAASRWLRTLGTAP